ncbi:MAG TPA: DegT/DnrJ/EryC1/StrS family aminotransferase [Thermoleophilia bacterium]|nr:DegT/DnrJ/EryC1/StrS family aminotransferase [Thermoleophilia bacterium]
MTLRSAADLIPRNNWDYGWRALVSAASGIYRHRSQAFDAARVLQAEPVWTNAGRTSLYAILRALDLPKGSSVGVPLFCCSVVFEAISQAGLTPRFIDSDLDSCNISVDDLLRKRADLRAVVPVHVFGQPADMDAVNAAAGDVPVIEDCAHSFLSSYRGRQTGLLGSASFFSFRCGKYLSAGEGSAILCRDPGLRTKIRQVVDSFVRRSTARMASATVSTVVKAALYNRPWYGLIGYPVGMRLDRRLNLTAKDGFEPGQIDATNLALIDERILAFREKVERQRQHAGLLLDAVEPRGFVLPAESPDRTRNWFQFPILFQDEQQRDRMADHLLARGVDTGKYLDGGAEVARAKYRYRGDCPNAERLTRTTLLVPIHYTLRRRDIAHIAASINEGSRILEATRRPESCP